MQRLNLLDSLMSFHSPICLTHSIRFTPPFEWLLLDSSLTQLGRAESPLLNSCALLSYSAGCDTKLRLARAHSCCLRPKDFGSHTACPACLCAPCCCDLLQLVPSRDECVYLFSRVRCRKQLACANGRVDGARFSATTPYTATLGRCLLVSLLLAFLVQRPGASSSTSANAAYECAVVAIVCCGQAQMKPLCEFSRKKRKWFMPKWNMFA